MINNILKLLRKYRNMTLDELSLSLGLSVSHLSLIENDKRSVSLGILYKYARYFGVDVSAMFYILEHVYNSKVFEDMEALFSKQSVEFAKWVHSPKVDKAG